MSDGVTGVYVLSGINAVFKPIEILYSDSNYVICKNDVQSSSGIRMYDEVAAIYMTEKPLNKTEG